MTRLCWFFWRRLRFFPHRTWPWLGSKNERRHPLNVSWTGFQGVFQHIFTRYWQPGIFIIIATYYNYQSTSGGIWWNAPSQARKTSECQLQLVLMPEEKSNIHGLGRYSRWLSLTRGSWQILIYCLKGWSKFISGCALAVVFSWVTGWLGKGFID